MHIWQWYIFAAILGIGAFLIIRKLVPFSIRDGDRRAYNENILTALDGIKSVVKTPQCKMSADVNENLKCLRNQQMSYYTTEYNIIKVLEASDFKGYQELQTLAIMVYDFFKSYAQTFDKDEKQILGNMMVSGAINRGGNIGTNLDKLKELMVPVTDFSPFKMGDTRPNARELTQAILANNRNWCSYIWFLIVGLVKQNPKILKFMSQNNINVSNIALRAEMIKRYMSEDVGFMIDKLCDTTDISKSGIPMDACSKGPRGPSDVKCDIFCGTGETICSLSFRAFSFYKAMGKSLNPALEFDYNKGYGANYKPKPFPKLSVKELLPPPSKRELDFWKASGKWTDKEKVPWPNALNVILTNPANPMVDISLGREDLSVAGTSGHAEALLTIAVLFDRYKDPQKLKDLVRGMMISICPHHHSIREIATAAYPSPYNLDFKFTDGPYEIIKNLL